MSSFVAYSLPSQTDYVYAEIASDSKHPISSTKNQFVFTPFDKNQHRSYYFELGELQDSSEFFHISKSRSKNQDTTRRAYTNMFNQIMEVINSGKVDKVVLSRIKKFKNNERNLAALFKELVNAHPQAFVYIIYHSSIGTWIGVSPEIILQRNESVYLTQAIAGTLSNSENSNWTNKEKEEQNYILRHLRESLDDLSYNYSVGETKELIAGQVKHIKTDVSISESVDMRKLLEIIHPGPALNGYPLEKAINYIKKIENHDRQFYCGIVGPMIAESVDLYANIRCMQVHQESFDLFLGGGIVADSEVESEWNETEMKATTLSTYITESSSSNALS